MQLETFVPVVDSPPIGLQFTNDLQTNSAFAALDSFVI